MGKQGGMKGGRQLGKGGEMYNVIEVVSQSL